MTLQEGENVNSIYMLWGSKKSEYINYWDQELVIENPGQAKAEAEFLKAPNFNPAVVKASTLNIERSPFVIF